MNDLQMQEFEKLKRIKDFVLAHIDIYIAVCRLDIINIKNIIAFSPNVTISENSILQKQLDEIYDAIIVLTEQLSKEANNGHFSIFKK